MRTAIVIFVLATTGCGDDCCKSGTHDAAVDAPADAGGACYPSGLCAMGHECGSGCCNYGERCELGACTCGTGAACLSGDVCTSGGPIAPAIDGCGVFCCGPASGVNCPI